MLAALAAIAAVAAAPAGGRAVRPGQLGHEGRWYTDDHGRVRILHGLNVVAKRAPYLPSSIGIGEDDAAFMARQGFNTIRLGVIYTAVEPRPGVYDDRYLSRIASTVRTFRRHGIYSLLDFHQDQYNERFQGQGFPDWAVLDDGLPAEPKYGFPLNYYLMPALQRTYDNFWANRRGPGGVGVQTRYAAAWRHVAARFRAQRGVMGYDLMNEPFPGSGVRACFAPAGCRRFERGRLSEFSRRMLRAIRSVDRSGLVHYEPATSFGFLGTAPSFHRPLRDPAVAFSWHLYCFQGLSLAGAPTIDDCPPYERHAFTRAERQARRDRAPQLLSEFGSTSDLGLIDRVADDADRARVELAGMDLPARTGSPTPPGPRSSCRTRPCLQRVTTWTARSWARWSGPTRASWPAPRRGSVSAPRRTGSISCSPRDFPMDAVRRPGCAARCSSRPATSRAATGRV